MLQTVAEANFDECLDGTRATFLGFDLGIVHQGQFDVLDRCGLGQQVVVLEDEADLAVAELGALIAAHPAYRHAIKEVFARGGRVEATYLVEQCGFARARSALDGHELTFVDLERDTTERMDHLVADLEVAANVLEFDDDFSIVFAHNYLLLFLRGPGMNGLLFCCGIWVAAALPSSMTASLMTSWPSLTPEVIWVKMPLEAPTWTGYALMV